VQPGYKALFDTTLPDALYDSCEAREFRWVNLVYQMQPSSREQLGQYVMSRETLLRQCLEDAGMECLVAANIGSL
jgi:hypothetical protein